jgi:hypothetical protein
MIGTVIGIATDITIDIAGRPADVLRLRAGR